MTAWTCPSCGALVSSPYCPACGERRLAPRDLTLRGLLGQAWKAFSSLDGRLLRSVVALVAHPGRLTVAHATGKRLPYLGPFNLFLATNVLFFATQSLTHTNIFSSTLDSHLHQQDWSALAQSLADARLAATHRTLSAYAPLFDQAALVNAKSLVILMVPPFAALLPLAFLRSRRPFVTHVVFATHLYAFLLLLFSAAMVVAAIEGGLGGGGLASPRVDTVLSIVNLAACAAWLYVAAGVVYEAKGVVRVVSALGLALAVGGIVLGYRFALFLITLYTT